MIRAYKYRIYPNQEQEILIAKHLGCSRWVYNYALGKKNKAYQEGGKQHDRDILAANNIKKFAFVKQNTVGTTEIHALRNMTKVTRSAQETA